MCSSDLLISAYNEPETRRLAPAFLYAPVLVGVAWVTLSERPGESRWGRPLRLGVVGLIAFGIVPSLLAPQAAWRVPIVAQNDWRAMLDGSGGRHRWDIRCMESLQNEQVTGKNPVGRLIRRWSH